MAYDNVYWLFLQEAVFLYRDYFGPVIEGLLKLIKKYKRTHGAHKKSEEVLADLLR